MLILDGAAGEGGGQILRSALALSLIRQVPFRIDNIRAGRPKPGLRAQHLRAVEAAGRIGRARVSGAELGARVLDFAPDGLHPGSWRFDIGTAGATTLLLQTVFVPLSLAARSSELILTGGTHVPWSPCFHYLAWHWLPLLQSIGFAARLNMDQAGYYPPGGGVLRARVEGGRAPAALQLSERGELTRVRIFSAVSKLPLRIAERQRDRGYHRLTHLGCELESSIEYLPSMSAGTVLLLLAHYAKAHVCTFALGQVGKPAEQVADEAVEEFLAYHASGAAVDGYLADQLILPLSFAGGPSEYSTSLITQHLLTNAEVVRTFGVAEIRVRGELGRPGLIEIDPSP